MLSGRHVARDLVVLYNDKVQTVGNNRGKLSPFRDLTGFATWQNLDQTETFLTVSKKVGEL